MRYFPHRRDGLRQLSTPISNEGRNAAAWVELAASESSKFEKRRVLAYWLLANKLWTGPPPNRKGYILPSFKTPLILENADKAIERIRRGLMDPVDTANKTIEFLKENNLSSSTIIGARNHLLLFLRYSRLGLDPEDLRVAVKRIRRRSIVLAAKLPTRDQIRSIFLAAPLKTKLFLSMLICTGARIGELRRVKVSDVDFTLDPVHVYFRETKTGPTRIGFPIMTL